MKCTAVLRLTVVLVVLVIYLLVGGALFHYVEIYDETTCELANPIVLRDVFFKYQHLVEDPNSANISALQFLRELQAASHCQMNEMPSRMSFSDGVYLAMTIISVIGYGSLVPKTVAGKIITMIYAAVGVPLFMLATTVIGDQMRTFRNWIVRVRTELSVPSTRSRPLRPSVRSNHPRCDWKSTVLQIAIMFIIGQMLLCLPALAAMMIEKWNYLDSYYFLFTTYSTIGFGDINMASKVTAPEVEVYRIMLYIWTLLGVALFNLLFEDALEFFRKLLRLLETKSDRIVCHDCLHCHRGQRSSQSDDNQLETLTSTPRTDENGAFE